MAELPILPLKTDALLADTAHLSAEEFGAYCRLLFTMWRHDARLIDDADELARIAGVQSRRWAAIAERVMRPMTVAEGIVSQKRLSSTWLDVQKLRRKRADAAATRWTSKRDASAYAHAYPNASDLHIQKGVICNANQIRKKVSKNFLPSEALVPTKLPQSEDEPAGLLATALPSGALAHPPLIEGATNSQEVGRGRKDIASSSLARVVQSKRWAG